MRKYTVTLQHIGQSFTVEEGELILDAAIRQGLNLPYSCRNGTCRTCLHQVVEGDVELVDAEACTITAAELEGNRRLLCMSLCHSDATFDRARRRQKPSVTDAATG